MRVARCVALVCLLSAACSDGDELSDLRSFALEGEVYEGDAPPESPDLLSEWGRIEAVVVDAPESVTAGEDFEVVLELRNPLQETVEVGPCPVWTGGFGGEDSFVALAGELPCDDIEQLAPGERIRLRLMVVAPPAVTLKEGGELAAFQWRLVGHYFRDVAAAIAIPMQEPK